VTPHQDEASYLIAAAAATSPWWLPWFRETSEIAALIVPILGVIWLAVQICLKIYLHFHPRRDPLDTDIP
jgi:hypothetical protein